MENTNDIFFSMGKILFDKNVDYYQKDFVEKLEESLREYLLKKYDLVEKQNLFKMLDELDEVVEDKQQIFKNICDYLISIYSYFTSYELIWCNSEDKKYINNPILQYNNYGVIDTLITNEKTSYSETAKFLLYYIKQNLEEIKSIKKKTRAFKF